uniref:LY6/PLAUR domain containing 2 n=1 Tax=Falco tinnunculus TaxID=100819 RepID=A0A8C4TVN0_FALTI
MKGHKGGYLFSGEKLRELGLVQLGEEKTQGGILLMSINCLTIHNCTQNETMCKTTLYSLEEVYTFEGVSTVTKMCSSACIPSDVDDIGTTRPVSCCYSELCNVDGAASLRISFVPVGILASSLCAAFWTRP